MSHKYYGVVRVFNTLTQGTAVAGLEAGSAVLSKEATEAVQDIYPNSIIAVTNHHVVGEQKNVMLNFHFSQTPFPASVLKVCPQFDLAFLHINTEQNEFKLANFDHRTQDLRPIELVEGGSILYDKSDAFAKVVSVGFPLGTPHQTITKGNITAKDMMNNNVVLYHDSLINPGNSGGPLLNSSGEVIGINTLIRSGPGAGLSFAIPINKAKEIANQLISNGKVIHPMIGISLINENNPETNLSAVKVGYVVPNSPAEKSGIMVNDIIIKVGNKDITKASEVISQISKNGINKKINILLKRRNRLIRLQVMPTDITNLQNN